MILKALLVYNFYILFLQIIWNTHVKECLFSIFCEMFHAPHCPSIWTAAVTVISQRNHIFRNFANHNVIWKHEACYYLRFSNGIFLCRKIWNGTDTVRERNRKVKSTVFILTKTFFNQIKRSTACLLQKSWNY